MPGEAAEYSKGCRKNKKGMREIKFSVLSEVPKIYNINNKNEVVPL
jgi:hypothetical protein